MVILNEDDGTIHEQSIHCLNGPFTINQTALDGFTIANREGEACIWVRGKRLAQQVHCLLNQSCGLRTYEVEKNSI